METRVLTAHIPVDMASQVDDMAARLDRPRSWIVKQALAAWLALENERDRLTRAALADVDAGAVIDHHQVQVWAESLGTATALPLPRLDR